MTRPEDSISSQGTLPTSAGSTPSSQANAKEISNWKQFALFLSGAALVTFAFSLLGRYFFLAELMGNFRLQIGCLMIPIAIVAMRCDQRPLGFLLILSIAWSLFSLGSVYVPSNQASPGQKSLKIMSFNVLWNNKAKEDAFKVIESANADIVVILEYTADWARKLRPLDSVYPHQLCEPRLHGFGIALFSKHPLNDSRVIQIAKAKTDCPALITEVDFDSQRIRLVAFHSMSPTTPNRLSLRNEEFTELASLLTLEKVPTIVMGDLNCTPWSPFLSDFMEQTELRDSRQGFGHQASWPNWMPLLKIPIDHALISDEVLVHSRTVGPSGGSDHQPIIFEVSTANLKND